MKSNRTKGVLESETKKLVSSITELVELRKETKRSVPIPTELKYLSIYANLDRMLSKLPQDVVEDLNVEFINITHAAIKRQRELSIIYGDN